MSWYNTEVESAELAHAGDPGNRWERYFFERHDYAELRNWANRLKLFRYFRAYGGMLDDRDSLDCAFEYNSLSELEDFFSFAGITPVRFTTRPPQPEPGKSYQGEVFAAFPQLIAGTEWISQPGHCEIAGRKVHIWCESGKILISIGGDNDVTAADVAHAAELEAFLQQAPVQSVDPPKDTKHYLCPRYYPEFFEQLGPK